MDPDTGADGLHDLDEVIGYRTDPCDADTDGGSIPDGRESPIGDPLALDDDRPRRRS